MVTTEKPKTKTLVLLESPYSGSRRKHDAYLRAAMLDSMSRNEAPYASHALYPQYLDDTDPEQRATGMACGLAWGAKAEKTVAYVDLGISPGMQRGLEFRRVPGWSWP